MVAVGMGDIFWLAPLVAPAGSKRWKDIGLDDFSKMYYAIRSAPLGRVPAEVVASAFYGFHPAKVARYIPAVWETTTPDETLETLRSIADDVFRAQLGDWVGSADAQQAADLLRRAADARCEAVGGRPLSAGYASLPWPDASDPHLTIWHAFTLLREYRGDSHIAALVANDIDPCECHLLMAAATEGGCECHQAFRQMGLRVDTETPPDPAVPTDREWPVADRRAALARLCERGVVREDGAITEAGMELHIEVERLTDRIASAPSNSAFEDAEQLTALIADPVHLLRSAGDVAAVAAIRNEDR